MSPAAVSFKTSSPSLRSALPLFLLAAILVWPSSVQASTHDHTRQGWFVGLGVGGGSAALTSEGQSTNREAGTGATLRAGFAFNPQIALGLESNIWFKTQNNVDFTLTTYTAALSFFPSGGLVLRAGIGGGDADATVSSGSSSVTATETGLGIIASAGYEFRVMHNLAIGPQLDFNYVNVDSFDANFFNLGIEANWYFIPR